jgi:hypothetical protein
LKDYRKGKKKRKYIYRTERKIQEAKINITLKNLKENVEELMEGKRDGKCVLCT